MAPTNYYVDPAIDANSGTGTIDDPFGDLQYALNTIVRNAANGDQINIKAGTAEVLAGSLNMTTYGVATNFAPLILRGFTTAANDGGTGEIDCGGNSLLWTNYRYLFLIDLDLHTFGNNDGVNLYEYCGVIHCRVHRGASSPISRKLVSCGGQSYVVSCYVYDAGSGGAVGIAATYALYNHVDVGSNAAVDSISINCMVACGNIVVLRATATRGIYGGQLIAQGNVVYNTTAGTSYGIQSYAYPAVVCNNNIICGFSGAGGTGILTLDPSLAGYNAFYNNTTNNAGKRIMDMNGDIILAADPFISAATGNFALTDTAKAALRSAGWPATLLGSTTDLHLTIGAVQYGAAEVGGGAVSISPWRGGMIG